VTSGIRVGTPAVTTRGLLRDEMIEIVALIDEVITNHSDEEVLKSVKQKVNAMMSNRQLYPVINYSK